MKLTRPEKLILAMLGEIHEKLGINGSIDGAFVQKALYTDNLWGLDWKYHHLLGPNPEGSPDVVKEVTDILDMWEFVEASQAKFSPAEKAAVEAAAGSVTFIGFDGNNESEHGSVMSFLVGDLARWSSFSERADLNSHSPTVASYLRMVEVFEPMRKKLDGNLLNVAQVVEILKARRP